MINSICHFTGVTVGLAVASVTLGVVTVQKRTVALRAFIQLELFLVCVRVVRLIGAISVRACLKLQIMITIACALMLNQLWG